MKARSIARGTSILGLVGLLLGIAAVGCASSDDKAEDGGPGQPGLGPDSGTTDSSQDAATDSTTADGSTQDGGGQDGNPGDALAGLGIGVYGTAAKYIAPGEDDYGA
jgi:hypothetical protein